jgi:hypothetical protein
MKLSIIAAAVVSAALQASAQSLTVYVRSIFCVEDLRLILELCLGPVPPLLEAAATRARLPPSLSPVGHLFLLDIEHSSDAQT